MATGVDDLEKAVLDHLRSPRGIENGMRGVRQLAQVSVDVAEAEATAAEVPEAAGFISGAADFLGLSGGWMVLLIIAGVIVNCKIIEEMLVRQFLLLPWGWGKGPASLVRAVFHPLDALELWVAKEMGQLAAPLITSLNHMLRQFLAFELGTTHVGTGGVTASQLSHVQSEINVMNARLGHQQSEITALQHQTQPAVQPAPGLATLEERVTRLERLMPVISHDLNVLHSDIVQLSHNENATHAEVNALEHALGGVRAEQMGVQDVLQQVQTTTTNIQHELSQALPQLDANTRHLHFLAPLSLLLVNGSPGLKNLEKLERKPCQCPRLPGLSGPDIDFLAVYEFITHG